MQIGQQIRDIRKQRGMLLRELAAKADLSEAYVCKLEKDHVSPGLNMLARIARALDCDVVEILRQKTTETHSV